MKIDSLRKKELKDFLKNINLKFNNYELLNLSLSHKSYINEIKIPNSQNNERLEFLGDSILGLVITEYLYLTHPEYNEGELARIKSFVVSEDTLSKIALRIHLNHIILIGKGEEVSGGRHKKTILADSMEAFLGSYYLDTNFQKAKELILKLFKLEIEKVIENKHDKDYKTLLQEYCQKRYKLCPSYQLKKEEGPEHDKLFHMEVYLNQDYLGEGEGRSKKEAEKIAAKNAYLKIISRSAVAKPEKS